MPFPRRLITVVAALGLALAPMVADAAAGGGSSFGSRGTRTWSSPPPTNTSPFSVQPMQRSVTPNYPSPTFGSPGSGYGQSGLSGRSSFMSGLFGGLLGAGIGGLLFGRGFFGGGLGFGGFLGFLLQILLIVVAVRFLIGLFRRSQLSPAGGPGLFPRLGPGAGYGGPAGGSAAAATSSQPIQIGPADYQAFERSLQDIQAAWYAQDVGVLRGLLTPEMLSYFAEQLSDLASRGLRNVVADVRLDQGDLSEAWTESGQDYATVAMRFSMQDYTIDSSGRVTDGSPNERVSRTEVWTFMRARGGRWLLSAIQQTR
jgi:predicted lipid-binding transport protein (Tim44 family)